jgi:putative endonuclease
VAATAWSGSRAMSDSSTNSSWWVYIVRCSDRSLYTGIATDVDRRVAQHNEGKGARYTRGRRPVSLVYCETQDSRSAASRREAEIKSLSRAAKETLIRARQTTGKPADY